MIEGRPHLPGQCGNKRNGDPDEVKRSRSNLERRICKLSNLRGHGIIWSGSGNREYRGINGIYVDQDWSVN